MSVQDAEQRWERVTGRGTNFSLVLPNSVTQTTLFEPVF